MKRLLLPLAATLALLSPATAGAQQPYPTVTHAGSALGTAHHRRRVAWHGTRHQALVIAEQKAYGLWHTEPCGGAWAVAFVSEQQLYSMTGVSVNANIVGIEGASSWESPAGPDVYTSPPPTWTACLTELDATRWPEVAPQPFNWYTDWTAICSSVLHEAGLLTGHGEIDQTVIAEPQYEPPGMTVEQLAVMRQSGLYDQARCGSEP